MATPLTAPNLSPRSPSDRVSSPRQTASERVAAVLAERIRSDEYHSGDLLPTERTLAADLGVHRRSVRMAIELLVQQGLVSHRPNCRPTVDWTPRETPDSAKTRTATPVQALAPSRRISASNLTALIMWHGGGPLEHAGTSQQRIFWGMNQSLMAAGSHAVFLDLGDVLRPEEEIAAQEAEHLRYVRDQRFGGALFYPYAYQHNQELVEEVSRSVPLVLLDRKLAGVDIDFVGIQNRRALFDVTQHLIAQGHRRIAYVTRHEPISSVQDRILGYLDAMRAPQSEQDGQGAPGLAEMLLTIPPYPDKRAWTIVDAVFGLPPEQRPTAAVCFTDYQAVDLAEHLAQLGLSVPQDVALTGFDNIVPALPSGLGLTTVAQPYEEIGIAAVRLLMRRRENPVAPPKSIELPAHLMLRASSAP